MSAVAAFTHTWKVGAWTLTMSVPPIKPGAVSHAVVEWDPSMPKRNLTASEQVQYDAGMAVAMHGAQQVLTKTAN